MVVHNTPGPDLMMMRVERDSSEAVLYLTSHISAVSSGYSIVYCIVSPERVMQVTVCAKNAVERK